MSICKRKKPLYKILLIGDTQVGKTSIIGQYCDKVFKETSNISTIGCDFKTKDIPIEDSVVTIEIWDTAGQEKFKSMTKNMFRGADGFILTYDITKEQSFKNVNQWINDIRLNAPEKSRVILIGNKLDLQQEQRVISAKQGASLAQEFGIPFFETSSKENINLHETFNKIVKDICEYNKVHPVVDVSIDLKEKQSRTQIKKSCC